MKPETKNMISKSISKAHEITPIPELTKTAYTKKEVEDLIWKDRGNCEVHYNQMILKKI